MCIGPQTWNQIKSQHRGPVVYQVPIHASPTPRLHLSGRLSRTCTRFVPILVKVRPNRACPAQHVVYCRGTESRPRVRIVEETKNSEGRDKYRFNCIITTTCSQHISALFIDFTSTEEAINLWKWGGKRKTPRRGGKERREGIKHLYFSSVSLCIQSASHLSQAWAFCLLSPRLI